MDAEHKNLNETSCWDTGPEISYTHPNPISVWVLLAPNQLEMSFYNQKKHALPHELLKKPQSFPIGIPRTPPLGRQNPGLAGVSRPFWRCLGWDGRVRSHNSYCAELPPGSEAFSSPSGP